MDANQITDPIQKAAEDRLAQLEAEDAVQAQPVAKADETTAKPVADRTATSEKVTPAPNSKDTTGIPSEADKQEIETAKIEADKEGKELDLDDKGAPKRDAQGKFVKRDKKPVEKLTLTPDEEKKFLAYQKQISTPYQHNETKQMLRWEKIKEKEAEIESKTQTAQKTLNDAIAKFNADVAAFRSEQARAKGTPEQYDKLAEKCQNEYTLKAAQVLKAENEGDLEAAKKLADEAAILKHNGEQATKFAEHLRKNPPPDDKQIKEQFAKNQKTWIDKAAIDFPEFAKADSQIRKDSVAYFQETTKNHPDAAKLPGFIYFAVEHCALKTAADRVPALEKDLGEYKAKVKELEALTNPIAGGVVPQKTPKKFEESSDDEQWAALQADAAQIR